MIEVIRDAHAKGQRDMTGRLAEHAARRQPWRGLSACVRGHYPCHVPRYRLPLLLTSLLFCGCELIGGIDDRALVSVTGGAPGSGGEGAGSEAGSAEGGQGGGCGVVGHDCLGGECIDGVCQPVLVTDVLSATALAVSGPNVYWGVSSSGAGEVRYCPKSGCDGSSQYLLGGLPEVTTLASALNTVFVVSSPSPGTIIGCPGGQPACAEYSFSVNAVHGPKAVAVDAINGPTVYFSTLGDQVDPAASALYSCPFGSCTTPTELLSVRASAIATDAEQLYWVDETTSFVRRCDAADCVDTDLNVTSTPYAGGLDLDVRAGWVTYAGLEKNIYRCELSGAGVCGTTIMLAETSTTVGTFAVDDAYVYFVEKSHDPRPIRRASLTGDGDEEIATGQVDVIELVQDEAAVYWIAAGEGTVGSLRKVAKPAQ